MTRLATVFGGSGFIGRHLVRRLAAQGWRVRVAVRDPAGAEFLRPMGDVGQVVPVFADIGNAQSVQAAVHGAELVVNLVGILFERGRRSFQAVHVDGAAGVAAAAKAAGARALVHISALGASAGSSSAYARSKAAGEQAVRAAFPEAVILRPSVVFGPEDDFFNRFAAMSSFTPVLPAFRTASGGPRFQPVYVGDVADAIVAATGEGQGGGTFELGGPRVYTLREIMQLSLRACGRRRLLLPLPLWVAGMQAAFLQWLPKPPLTPDQVKLLAADNVVEHGFPGLGALGIAPTAAEMVVPGYLSRLGKPRMG